MKELNDIYELIDDATAAIYIYENTIVLNAKQEPCYKLSPNDDNVYYIDMAYDLVDKYKIKANRSLEEIERSEEGEEGVTSEAVSTQINGGNIEGLLEDLMFKLDKDERLAVIRKIIRRSEKILCLDIIQTQLVFAMIAFVSYRSKERFIEVYKDDPISFDELSNLIASLVITAKHLLYYLGANCVDFEIGNARELTKQIFPYEYGNMSLEVFKQKDDTPNEVTYIRKSGITNKRGDFSLYRKKDAIMAMLQALGVKQDGTGAIPDSQIKKFVYFLTGNGTMEDDIRNTSVADVFKPSKDTRNNATINKDLDFVAARFEDVGLFELSARIKSGKTE